MQDVIDILVDYLQHHISKFRIELAAPALGDLIAHDILRQHIAITALGSHRIIGISHSDDARIDGDLIALLAIGIALAIEGIFIQYLPEPPDEPLPVSPP